MSALFWRVNRSEPGASNGCELQGGFLELKVVFLTQNVLRELQSSPKRVDKCSALVEGLAEINIP